jgi:hypothetical protein
MAEWIKCSERLSNDDKLVSEIWNAVNKYGSVIIDKDPYKKMLRVRGVAPEPPLSSPSKMKG